MRYYNVQTNCPGSGRLGHASGNKSSATFRPLDQVSIKPLRSAVVSGRMNDTCIWGQLEFECVEAERQSLSYGFHRSYLEAPVLKEIRLARQTAYPFNSLPLCLRKVPSSVSVASKFLVRSSRSTPIPCVDDHAPRKPNRQEEKQNQKSGKSGRSGRPFSVSSKTIRDRSRGDPSTKATQ